MNLKFCFEAKFWSIRTFSLAQTTHTTFSVLRNLGCTSQQLLEGPHSHPKTDSESSEVKWTKKNALTFSMFSSSHPWLSYLGYTHRALTVLAVGAIGRNAA